MRTVSFSFCPLILFYSLSALPLFGMQNPPQDTQCFPIDRIKFIPLIEDNSLNAQELPKEFNFASKIAKKYRAHCFTSHDIATLLGKLNYKAVQKGYITSKFGIGAQDLATKELLIQTQIGKIGKIDYKHNGHMSFFAKDFALKSDDILNLKILESGILNLEKTRHLNTTMQILPTEDKNLSDISILIQKTSSPFSGQYIFDNGGALFDKYQNTLLLGYDNPFKLADSIYLYMLGAVPFNGAKISKNYNFYSSLSYSVPIRRFSFENSLAFAINNFEIPLQNFKVAFSGKNVNFDSKLSYRLFTNPKHNIFIGLGFGNRFARSYIEDEELIVQRNDILHYSLFAHYTFSHKQYKLNTSFSLMHGFSLPNPATKGFNYVVPVLNLYSSLPFLIAKVKAIYTTSIKTQVAQSQLYANDQMLIGGRYTVRGFDKISFSGQFGILNRNDLVLYLPSLFKDKWQTTFAPSLAFDMGYVRDLYPTRYAILPNDGVFLVGGGLGLQIIMKHINLQTWWYFPLYNSHRQTSTQSFFFSIGLNV